MLSAFFQGAGETGRTMTNQRGFTLIEMAFVLAIIGLLLGGGIVALGPLLYKARVTQTNTALDQIESALVLFAIQNNRLPCPADGSLTNTSANYGLENGGGAPPTNKASCGVALANSIIPWKTLGLDEQYSVDGWGNRISYFPANGAIAGVNTLVDDSTGPTKACAADATGNTCTLCLSRDVTTATRATLCDIFTQSIVPSYPYANYIAVYATGINAYGTELTKPQGVAAPATSTDAAGDGGRAAYVLVSHGPSGWYGWNKAGHQIAAPPPARTFKAYNDNGSAGAAGSLGFVQGTPIGTAQDNGNANYFDDIVRWRSPAFIIQLCGSGACGNP